jgi:hypothetical protein
LDDLGLGFPGRGQAKRQEQQTVDDARDQPGTSRTRLRWRGKFEVRGRLGVQT